MTDIEKELTYLQATEPFLFRMLTQHRTHEDKSIDFKGRKYLIDLYLDKSPNMVVRKSTQCFPKDTLIFTNKGVKPIQHILPNDYVLTHKGRYRKVLNILANKKHKTIKHITDCGIGLEGTLDHPYYSAKYSTKKYHYSKKDKLKTEWQTADKLYVGDYLSYPISNIEHDIIGIKLTESNNDWIRSKKQQSETKNYLKLNYGIGKLFGFYIAEGWSRKKGTEIGFGFHIKENNYCEIVKKELLKITTAKIYNIKSYKNNSQRVVLRDRTLQTFFKDSFNCGAKNKSLPSWVFNSDKKFMEGLIYGLFHGDGSLKGKQICYTSGSKELIKGVWQLLFLNNIYCNFRSIGRGYRIHINGENSIRIAKILKIKSKSKYSRLIFKDDCTLTRIKKIKHINKNKTVYNLEIYEDNSYIANGYIVHNCGISEWLIGYAINESILGNNVLYVLPTEVIRTRFVSARFNKTIEYSNIYNNQTVFNSINLKSFGTGIINFIGSNAQSGFAEFVAKTVIKDEVDYCNQLNLAMSSERQSAQEIKKSIDVGNPTIEDFGIDYSYKKSDKKKWVIKCKCGHRFEPDFFKHIVQKIDNDYVLLDKEYERGMKRDIYCICDKCHKPFDRFVNGEWIKENLYSDISGYYVSKMFSTKTKIKELVDRFEDGLLKPIVLQRFYNGDLGLPFTAEGSKILKSMLSIEDYYELDTCDLPCVAGIDVGNELHCIVGQITPEKKVRIIKRTKLKDIKDLLTLNQTYNIICGVIDARPEIRLSRQLVATFKSWWMCDFLTESEKDSFDLNRKIIKVDRTTAFDSLKEDILVKKIIFPKTENTEYNEHLESSTRIWEENEKHINKGRYVWAEGSKPDHFLLATVYMNQALRLIVMSK